MSIPKAFPAHLLPKITCQAIRQAPRAIPDMECQGRFGAFVGRPCAGSDTRVMAHNPFSPLKGQATKGCDTGVLCLCAACHDILDGRDPVLQMIVEKWPMAFMEQVIRAEHTTRAFLIREGIITAREDA